MYKFFCTVPRERKETLPSRATAIRTETQAPVGRIEGDERLDHQGTGAVAERKAQNVDGARNHEAQTARRSFPAGVERVEGEIEAKKAGK